MVDVMFLEPIQLDAVAFLASIFWVRNCHASPFFCRNQIAALLRDYGGNDLNFVSQKLGQFAASAAVKG